MGVRGLWRLVLPIGRRISIETLEGKILAIDASIWLSQFLSAMREKETGSIRPGAHLIGFFRRLAKLRFHGIRPVLIFDGATPEIKLREVANRRKRRLQQQEGSAKSASKDALQRLAKQLLVQQLKQSKKEHQKQQHQQQKEDDPENPQNFKRLLQQRKNKKRATQAFSESFCLPEEEEQEQEQEEKKQQNDVNEDENVENNETKEKARAMQSSTQESASELLATQLQQEEWQPKSTEREEIEISDDDDDDDEEEEQKNEEVLMQETSEQIARELQEQEWQSSLTNENDASQKIHKQSDWDSYNTGSNDNDNQKDQGEQRHGISRHNDNGNDDENVFNRLETLPSANQRKDVILDLKRQYRLQSRRDFMPVAGQMNDFSSVQLHHFLKSARFNRQVEQMAKNNASQQQQHDENHYQGDTEAKRRRQQQQQQQLPWNKRRNKQRLAALLSTSSTTTARTTLSRKAKTTNQSSSLVGKNKTQRRGRVESSHEWSDPKIHESQKVDMIALFGDDDDEESDVDASTNNDTKAEGVSSSTRLHNNSLRRSNEIIRSDTGGNNSEQNREKLQTTDNNGVGYANKTNSSSNKNKDELDTSSSSSSSCGSDDEDYNDEGRLVMSPDTAASPVDQEEPRKKKARKNEPQELDAGTNTENNKKDDIIVPTLTSKKHKERSDDEDEDDDIDWEDGDEGEEEEQRSRHDNERGGPKDDASDQEQENLKDTKSQNDDQDSDDDDSVCWEDGDGAAVAQTETPPCHSSVGRRDYSSPSAATSASRNYSSPAADEEDNSTMLTENDFASAPVVNENAHALQQAQATAANLTNWAGRAFRKAIATHAQETGSDLSVLKKTAQEQEQPRTEESSTTDPQSATLHLQKQESYESPARIKSPQNKKRARPEVEQGQDDDDDDEKVPNLCHMGKNESGTSDSNDSPDVVTGNNATHFSLLDNNNNNTDELISSLTAEQGEGLQQLEMATVTDEMKAEIIKLIELFGIPYVQSPAEAEAQCVALEALQLVDGIVTEDSDAFVFGGKTIYKNIFENQKYVEEYRASDAEQELALGRNHMIALAMLLGSDYTEGVKGVGIVNGMEILQAFNVANDVKEGLSDFRKWVEGFDPLDAINEKKPAAKGEQEDASLNSEQKFHAKHKSVRSRWIVPKNFPAADVLNAYVNPVVDKSSERFSWGVPDLDGLIRFCTKNMGWEALDVKNMIDPVIERVQQVGLRQTRMERYFMKYEDGIKFAEVKSKRLREVFQDIQTSNMKRKRKRKTRL